MPADIPPADEPAEPDSSPDLRASDADRDRVIDVLRAATADGRLTADEFNERMEAALSSRTIRELTPLTADLATTPASRAPESAQAKDVIRIDQRGGSVQRSGRWMVPRRLELHPSWCDVTIDFTDAVIRHDTLLIDMRMRGGSLALVIGPGILVDADSLTAHFTDIELSANVGPEAPIVLQVRLVGRVRYGWIGTRRTPPS